MKIQQEGRDNERLEFLVNVILNFISGEYLYQIHPEWEKMK